MKRIGILAFILFTLILTGFSTYALDNNLLLALLKEEIKKSAINREVNIGEIKFIGFSPKERCIPDRLKIREIKRPSSIEFTFYCGERLYRAIANYEVISSIYISQKNMKRGDIVLDDDIMEIKKPMSKIPVGAITEKSELVGKVLKRTIAQGIVIKEDHLYRGAPVKRGSPVQILVTSGRVTVMTEGVLKSDATVGTMAKVQCFQTGKEIVGQLIEKDKVRVLL